MSSSEIKVQKEIELKVQEKELNEEIFRILGTMCTIQPILASAESLEFPYGTRVSDWWDRFFSAAIRRSLLPNLKALTLEVSEYPTFSKEILNICIKKTQEKEMQLDYLNIYSMREEFLKSFSLREIRKLGLKGIELECVDGGELVNSHFSEFFLAFKGNHVLNALKFCLNDLTQDALKALIEFLNHSNGLSLCLEADLFIRLGEESRDPLLKAIRECSLECLDILWDGNADLEGLWEDQEYNGNFSEDLAENRHNLLAKMLGHSANIKKLIIEDCTPDANHPQPIDDLLSKLGGSCALNSFQLDSVQMDNESCASLAKYCKDHSVCSVCEERSVCSNCKEHSMCSVHEEHFVYEKHSVRELILRHSDFRTGIDNKKDIKNFLTVLRPGLQILSLQNAELTDEMGVELMQTFSNVPDLIELSLEDSGIGDKTAEAFHAVMKNQTIPLLRYCNLINNIFTDEGQNYIVDGFMASSSIETIDLHWDDARLLEHQIKNKCRKKMFQKVAVLIASFRANSESMINTYIIPLIIYDICFLLEGRPNKESATSSKKHLPSLFQLKKRWGQDTLIRSTKLLEQMSDSSSSPSLNLPLTLQMDSLLRTICPYCLKEKSINLACQQHKNTTYNVPRVLEVAHSFLQSSSSSSSSRVGNSSEDTVMSEPSEYQSLLFSNYLMSSSSSMSSTTSSTTSASSSASVSSMSISESQETNKKRRRDT